jgi:predicted metal-dependent hydrolase
VTLFDLVDPDPFDNDLDDIDDDVEESWVQDPEPPPVEPPSDVRPDDTRIDWPEVEIRISARRRKTSEAKWVGGRIVVSLPSHLSAENREKTVQWLVERLVSKNRKRTVQGDDALLQRSIMLSHRYLVGAEPASVRWVTNQNTRWGSCSCHTKEIRISHRLRVAPEWVLAHLTHPNHSPAFHELANRFPRHGEAATFLSGYTLGLGAPKA